MATPGFLLQWDPAAGAFPSTGSSFRRSVVPLFSSLSRPIVNINRRIGRLPRVLTIAPLEASRRISRFHQENGLVRGGAFDSLEFEEDIGEEDDEEEEEEEEEDRSLDLLVQFVHNVFRKLSRRVSRAVRSMLPRSIPSKLVKFSVNGTIILAFLWVLKALLQVVCTLGTIVFVCILVIRGVLSAVMYQRVYRSKFHNMDEDDSIWTGAQPAT